MTGYPQQAQLLDPGDFSVDLLAALASLTPAQREAWIDRYVRGEPLSVVRRQYVHKANARLRPVFAELLGG